MDTAQSFMSIFSDLEDPRFDRRKKHKLIDILIMALCGVICGADSWESIVDIAEEKYDWFKSFLELPNGIPSHDTFNRVFSLLDPEQFLDCFGRWVSAVIPTISDDTNSLLNEY